MDKQKTLRAQWHADGYEEPAPLADVHNLVALRVAKLGALPKTPQVDIDCLPVELHGIEGLTTEAFREMRENLEQGFYKDKAYAEKENCYDLTLMTRVAAIAVYNAPGRSHRVRDVLTQALLTNVVCGGARAGKRQLVDDVGGVLQLSAQKEASAKWVVYLDRHLKYKDQG